MTRILIADPNPATRKALTLLLNHRLGLNQIGEAEDVEKLIQALACTPPDLLLLDWRLYGSPAPETTQLLLKAYPNLKIVLLSINAADAESAQKAGAAFIWKGAPTEDVLAVIRAQTEMNRVP